MNKKRNIMHLDLLVILIWIIATIVFAIIPSFENSLIRTIFGIPMVLFIPGYVLVSALFIRTDDLWIVRRIALSFGLSIVAISLLGLLLNFTVGLTYISTIFALCIYDIVLIFASNYRRGKLPEEQIFLVRFDELYETVVKELRPKGKLDLMLTIVLIFTAVIAIMMIYYTVTTPKIGERFTEFYILDNEGRTNNYSDHMKLGSPYNMYVYVSNHEYEAVNYTIVTSVDENISTYKYLTLGNNETQKQNITFLPDKDGNNMKLKFSLFKENNSKIPYRELYLWINVSR